MERLTQTRARSSGTRDRCVETPSTNNPDSSEDVCQCFDRMMIERFTPDRHKIVFKKVSDEHPDSDVDKDTMSATVKLAKVLDELDIGQLPAECLLMVLSSRRKLVTSSDELRPVQGGTEDADEHVMTSHTEICEGCEATSVEEGHEVERVTVRSDVVEETKSVGEAQPIGKRSARCKHFAKKEQDQGPQERASTKSRSNSCSDLKDQSRTGTSTTCPSKADLNKLIDEKLRAKERWSLNTDTGSQLSWQSPSSKRSARKKRNTNRILARSEGTRSHLIILSVQDDQKIVQDNALPKRMNRLTLESDELGRTR